MNILKERGFHGLNIFSDPLQTFSQKAIFNGKDFLSSYENGLVGFFHKKSDTSNIMLYYSKIIDASICYNNYVINKLYNVFNQFLPEWVILLLFGSFGIFVFIINYAFNWITSIIVHIMYLNQMFRNQTDVDSSSGMFDWMFGLKKEKTSFEWEPESSISFTRITKWFFLFLWSIPIFIICFFILPIFMTLYSIFSPYLATYSLEGGNKNNNLFTFLLSILSYQKIFFIVLFTVSIINSVSSSLGNAYLLPMVLAIIISAYFLNIYQTTISVTDKTETPDLTSFKQASVNGKKIGFIGGSKMKKK